jgi:ABC-type lipoprotein export system ATPase subunit
MTADTLRTKGLMKIYRTGAVEVTALRGVDFEAAKGEFIVMLGPSGSGKSTFLNIVGASSTIWCRASPRGRTCPSSPRSPAIR